MKFKHFAQKCFVGLLVCQSPYVVGETLAFVSADIGVFSYDEVYLSLPGDVTPTYSSSSDSGNVLSLAWGKSEPSARFSFEYYYQTADLEGFNSDYEKHNLFYSGYWTPNLFVPKLHGILGGGIGVADLRLDSDDPQIGDDFRDREEQVKVTVGVEYRIMESLTVKASYELHYSDNFSDRVNNRELEFDEGSHGGFMIGVVGTF